MVVAVRELGFRYPDAPARVLDGLDFEIAEGEIFGFLGPNGSGKSTTQKLLTGLLGDYDGEIRVFDRELCEHGPDYRERIGVCFEFPNLYEKLTAEENLDFYRRFYDGETESPESLLERLDLPVGDVRRVGQYSKGMKMRVVLARSLVNRPQLWFLDEPTTGQDPEHAVAIRELIRERADAGATVFLTTHDMTVADQLCDRIAFLVDGRIATVDTPRELKLAHARKTVRVEVRGPVGLAGHEFSLADAADKRRFLDFIAAHETETIHTQEPSLEDVFLRVTGRGLR